MIGPVVQRYLLAAQASGLSVPASGSLYTSATCAPVPLGGNWRIRIRWLNCRLFAADNSGELQVFSIDNTWQLLNASGTILFVLDSSRSIITPPWTFPKISGVVAWGDDFDQELSVYDQNGGVATTIVASTSVMVVNLDAANPHTFNLGVNAVLEFTPTL
jgi:hypothetical protein